MLRITPDLFPDALRPLDQWVTWRAVPRPAGKPAKFPFSPGSGGAASVTRPASWGNLADAVRDCRDPANGFTGVGFVFAKGDPFAGVDLDDCRNPTTGAIDPDAARLVADLGSYAEVSPSGTGVKAVVRARMGGARHRANGIEAYDHSRFFAMTGHRLAGCPADVQPAQAAMDRLEKSIAPPEPTRERACTQTAGGFPGTVDELLARAFAAKNGAKVYRYWMGDLAGKRSPSEALLGLAQLLAFWTGPNPDRLEAVLMRSALFGVCESERAKWWSRRADSTWGRRYVVHAAIDSCAGFFNGSGPPAAPSALTGAEEERPAAAPTCVRMVQDTAPPPTTRTPNAVALAWEHVQAGEMPPGIDRIVARRNQAERRQLAALCWHLAKRTDGSDFFLSGDDARKLFGVSRQTVSNWLRSFQRAPLGFIQMRRWGNARSGKANTYRWVGFANMKPNAKTWRNGRKPKRRRTT